MSSEYTREFVMKFLPAQFNAPINETPWGGGGSAGKGWGFDKF